MRYRNLTALGCGLCLMFVISGTLLFGICGRAAERTDKTGTIGIAEMDEPTE